MVSRSDRAPATLEVRFRLLGPLEVSVADRSVVLGGLRPRVLLAMLLTAEGATVSEEALVEALWGQDPPTAARNSLQSHVSRLRASFNDADADRLGTRLIRRPGGYQLRIQAGELDVARVEALLRDSRMAEGDPWDRVRLLEEARSWWRGPSLVDLLEAPGYDSAGLGASRARFDELQATVEDDLAEAQLAVGRHVEMLPWLGQVAGRQPGRERTHRLLALALHRAGRASEALAVLRRYRQRLADDMGLDASDGLDHLETAILRGDPALAPPSPPEAASAPEQTTPRGDVDSPPPAVLAHVSTTPLVGRTVELDQLQGALAASRLVTVTGPGGVGKTRLVFELMSRRDPPRDETMAPVVMELSALRAPEAVIRALAARLQVRPGPGIPIEDAVLAYLASMRGVVVLDNCEHLLGAITTLAHRILGSAPGITVLATSRERLRVNGEQVLPLAPLPVPEGAADAALRSDLVDSVRLFVDRATRSRPSFALTASTRPVVEDLCRRLDGLPLAIELAAGQLGALGLADLRDRLDDRLDLFSRLSGGPRSTEEPARHDTLRAVIDWSYTLLDASEQEFLERLAVFDGGFTLAAAMHVAADQAIAPARAPARVHAVTRLVDASLVVATDDEAGRLRYSMLDTIRTFALERLDVRGRRRDARVRHLDWVVSLAEQCEAELDGPREVEWARTVRVEFANIRSAWHTAMDIDHLDGAARITIALSTHGQWRGDSELWAWARTLAGRTDIPAHLEAAVLGAAAQASYMQGDLADTEQFAKAGIDRSDGRPGDRGWWSVVALHVLAMYAGAFSRAEALAADACTAPDVPPTWQVVLRGNVALARLYDGDLDGARRAWERCRDDAASCQSTTGQAWVDYVHGEVVADTDPGQAATVLDRAVTSARTVGASFVEGVATVALAAVATRSGSPTLALNRFAEVIRHWQRTGMWVQQWTALRNLAELLIELERDAPAVVLLAAADADDSAPAVTGPGAERIRVLWDRLHARLGHAAVEQLAGSAVQLSRDEVVAHALDVATTAP